MSLNRNLLNLVLVSQILLQRKTFQINILFYSLLLLVDGNIKITMYVMVYTSIHALLYIPTTGLSYCSNNIYGCNKRHVYSGLLWYNYNIRLWRNISSYLSNISGAFMIGGQHEVDRYYSYRNRNKPYIALVISYCMQVYHVLSDAHA